MIVFISMVLSGETHKKSTMFFIDSVFPEPVIPEITIDWDFLVTLLRASFAAETKLINPHISNIYGTN